MSIAKFSLIALAAAAVSLSAYAGSSDASGKVSQAKAQPEAFTGGMKLLKTYFETNNAGGAALASGFNPYGSALTVNCTVSAGCFVIVNANAQVQGVATVNPTAIAVKVNGVSINAPFNTPVGTTSYTVVNYQTGIAVPLGTHTITTEFYTTQATNLNRYNTEVKLYK